MPFGIWVLLEVKSPVLQPILRIFFSSSCSERNRALSQSFYFPDICLKWWLFLFDSFLHTGLKSGEGLLVPYCCFPTILPFPYLWPLNTDSHAFIIYLSLSLIVVIIYWFSRCFFLFSMVLWFIFVFSNILIILDNFNTDTKNPSIILTC